MKLYNGIIEGVIILKVDNYNIARWDLEIFIKSIHDIITIDQLIHPQINWIHRIYNIFDIPSLYSICRDVEKSSRPPKYWKTPCQIYWCSWTFSDYETNENKAVKFPDTGYESKTHSYTQTSISEASQSSDGRIPATSRWFWCTYGTEEYGENSI